MTPVGPCGELSVAETFRQSALVSEEPHATMPEHGVKFVAGQSLMLGTDTATVRPQ